MEVLKLIQECFSKDAVYYTSHARNEMDFEEFGRIYEAEVYESIMNSEIIETYKDDKPYPSYLLYGQTNSGRPLHTVIAVDGSSGMVIVVTVYHPHPERWFDNRRRKS